MSVTVDAQIRRRPFPNPLGDPALPVMIWYAQGAITMDATLGSANVAIILNPGGVTRSGRAWSIELSAPSLSAPVDDVVAMFQSNNLDNIGPGLNNPISKRFAQKLVGDSTVISSPATATEARDLHPRMFLGAQGSSVVQASIRMRVPNTDNNIFAWFCAGYEWGPGWLNLGLTYPVGGFVG